MKTCTKCKVEKLATLEFFKPHTSTKSGLSSWCRQCTSEYNKSNSNKISQKKYNKSEKGKTTLSKWVYQKQGIYEWYDGDISLYIGQSKRLNARISMHKALLKNPEIAPKSNYYLYPLLQQHQNPLIRIIEECSPEVLLEREKYYINILKPKYNKISI
jgi:hypothetical protein